MRWTAIGAVSLLSIGVVACGGSADPSAGTATGSIEAPTSSGTPSPTDDACPASVEFDMDATESSLVIDELERLRPTLAAAQAYGAEHADQFGVAGFHWNAPGDASVFVSFAGDLDEHRTDLTDLVEFPDELIVCRAATSQGDAEALQASLMSDYAGRIISTSSGTESGRVEVQLNPNEEALAVELAARYGEAVDVSVGALAYPIERAERVCGEPLTASAAPGLDLALVGADQPVSVTATGSVELTARLTNGGTDVVELEAGLPRATVTDAAGGPLTSDVRAVADIGINYTLEPGATEDVEVEALLASCDPAVGYIIGPGEHFVVIQLGELISSPHPFTIAG